MPALKVWEPLLVGGDDLRLVTTILIIFRLFQSSLLIALLYNLFQTVDINPDYLVITGCLEYSEDYWLYLTSVKVACFLVLAYTLGAVVLEAIAWKISGVGTPTETEKRQKLEPLCKCIVVPMFILRCVGFALAVMGVIYTDHYCDCLRDVGVTDFLISCQLSTGWPYIAKVLVICMGIDVILHIIMACYISKKRLLRWHENNRGPIERSFREKSWETACKRCCQCSSIMTCYMFGGRNLTSGGYADVAIALTDFLDDGGSLDIVPSDIAAALICLVNVQKQKQIECKQELLKDSHGLFEDTQLATKVLRMLRESARRKKNLLSSSRSFMKSVFVETDGIISDSEEGFDELIKKYSLTEGGEEEEVEVIDFETLASADVEALQEFMLRNETLEEVSFRLVHDNHRINFQPRISNVLDQDNAFDRLVLGEGARYSQVALAAYSWMLYVWTSRCTGCFGLAGATCYEMSKCKACCCHKRENIIGDNACGWKHIAVMKSVGIEESDILYANFKNGLGVNPYMIVVDRRWKTLVIAIRGTLSFEDMITDVSISPQSLEELGKKFGFNGVGEYCHNGILAGARWIYEDLQRHEIFDNAISGEYSGYHIRIIGHSLGAGVAAMLGLMLRKKYPRLMCLCFSPPGCVFTQGTAEESKQYACSYVLNSDVVPRLSYDSLVKLRNDVIEMVARIKVPKHKVFNAHFTPGGEKVVSELIDSQLYKEDLVPDSKFWRDFEAYKTQQRKTMSDRNTNSARKMYDTMALPGRIIQMVRTSDDLSNNPCLCCLNCLKCTACCGMDVDTKTYKVRWSENDDLAEIFISPSMLVDHFPYNVARALVCAAKSYDIPFDEGREAIMRHKETQYN